MSALSQVADTTRKIIITGVALIVGVIVLLILFNVGLMIKEIIAPTPPAPPTVSYGALPALSFPLSSVNKQLSYTINTLSGSLPTFPDRLNVYKINTAQPNLLNLDKAKQIAQAGGFTDAPIQVSDSTYKWYSTTNILTFTLGMDLTSFDFMLTSPYSTNPIVLGAANLPDVPTAQKVSDGFFSTILPLPDYIDTTKTTSTLLSIINGRIIPAASLSSAQLIRFDYFPKDIDKLPVVSSSPNSSLIYALIASSDTSYPQVVEAQYIHKQISSDKATYPIKTAQQALDDLKQEKGFIASFSGNSPTVNITSVSLGYYESPQVQEYLEPVIIFQGDDNFTAYVPAIVDKWIQK